MKYKLVDLRGFTLIEVMVVVVILSILAAIVVPRLTGRTDEARVIRAEVDMRNIEATIELFRLDNGFYPSTEQGIEALVRIPSIGKFPRNWKKGGYLKKMPMDPWGTLYLYLAPGAHGAFDIYSLGADAEVGGEGKNADIGNWQM